MMGINKVILVGNLGGDPEIRKTASGQSIALFNLATSRSWVDREGRRQESADWHRIVVWGKLGETCANHLSKGRQVYIEGRIQTRSWEDEKGQKRYTTEVIAHQVLFLGGAPKEASADAEKGRSYQSEPRFGASVQTGDSSSGGAAASGTAASSAGGGAKESELPF